MQAQLVVFFLSAALHELVISVPCRTVRLWAFIGMFAQAPLVLLTKKIEGVFGKAVLPVLRRIEVDYKTELTIGDVMDVTLTAHSMTGIC